MAAPALSLCPECNERPANMPRRGICSRCYQKLRNAGRLEILYVHTPKVALRLAQKQVYKEATKLVLLDAHAEARAEVQRLSASKSIADHEARKAKIDAWAELIRQGTTLQEIGDANGITRERVRQQLAKFGYTTKALRPKRHWFVKIDAETKRKESIERVIAWLEARVIKRGDDECWPWIGPTTAVDGLHCYGKIRAFDPLDSIEGKETFVHRIVYLLNNGPIPKGDSVDHICFNTLCCNPSHLQVLSRGGNCARKDPTRVRKAKFCAYCGGGLLTTPSGCSYCPPCAREASQVKQALKKQRPPTEVEGHSTTPEGAAISNRVKHIRPDKSKETISGRHLETAQGAV